MALRVRNLQQRYVFITIIGLVLLAVVLYIASARSSVSADTTSTLAPSVLCAPNVCNSNEANDSLQDVLLYNADAAKKSGSTWLVRNNFSDTDSDSQVLEIADQSNHVMEKVTIGVYVTKDVYDAMPSRALTINFVNRDCNIGSDPEWTIKAVDPMTSSNSANLGPALYKDPGTSGTDGWVFCNNGGNKDAGVSFNLSAHKSLFQPYGVGVLMYTKIEVTMANFKGNLKSDHKNVRFRLELPSTVCNGLGSTCRGYLALVASKDDPQYRNFSLSTQRYAGNPNPLQKKVTNNKDEYEDDGKSGRNPGKDVYDYFNRTYAERMIRQYIEFGLECSVTTTENRPIYIYDINDGDNVGSQTHGWVGGLDIIGVVLQYYNASTGTWEAVSKSAINQVVGGKVVSGLTNATYANFSSSTAVSSRNRNLYTVGGDNATTIIPKNDDHVVTVVRLDMLPKTRYRIAITPDHQSNFIAVGIPGDQIYGLVGCDDDTLHPHVDGEGALSAGSAAVFTDKIMSDSSSTSNATGIKWKAYGFVVKAGDPVPSLAGDSDDDYGSASPGVACNGLFMCEDLGGNMTTGETIPSKGEWTSPTNTTYTNTASLTIGDRVCSYMAISPYKDPVSPRKWRISPVTCYIIARAPSVQVWGSDIRVGSPFVTSSANDTAGIRGAFNLVGGSYRGSWGEYGLLAPGLIRNVASGAGLSMALASTTNVASTWSRLSFANTSLAGSLGNFAPAVNFGQIPDVKTYLTKAAAKGGLTIKAVAGPTDIGAFEPNVVYVVSGTATIRSNIINNSSAAGGVTALRQMVVIADTIQIDPSVTQVDAWLVAPEGTINTCLLPGGDDQPLTASLCSNTLKVNGPLMAATILSRRTTGDGTTAAETYDLKGDAYMWARRVSEDNGSIHTTYVTELPPRY